MDNFYRLGLTLFILLIHINPLVGQEIDTLNYTVLINDKIAGYSQEWREADGRWRLSYKINDRGRGDSLEVSYIENEDGFPIYIRCEGHDYFKKPIKEIFELKDGIATWENDVEKERRNLTEHAFYINLRGRGANLTRSLLKNGHRVKLLPEGEASLNIMGPYPIINRGREMKLTLVATNGLEFRPLYEWLDEEEVMFAQVSGWTSTIRKGYEHLRAQLWMIQQREEAEFYRHLTLEAVESPDMILISEVNLFDAEKGKMIPKQHLLIQDGIITQIASEAFRGLKSTGKVRIIDGRGLSLLPGLIDMHVHYNSNTDGLFHIANGVTSVRDLGNNFGVLAFKQKIESGVFIGPQLEMLSGLIDGKGPFAGPTPALAASVEEAVDWVDTFAAKGYGQIKIYSSIKPEWVAAIVKRAHHHGLRVSGHIPAFMTATQAIQAGYDEIQHINMIFLNFYGDTVDTRSPLRFTLPAEQAAQFDFKSKEFEEFVQLLKQHRITLDPTVNVFEGMFTSRAGQVEEAYASIVDRFPSNIQRSMKAGGNGLPVPDGYDKTYQQSFQAFLKMIKKLYDAGIQMVPGTDAMAGFSMHRELELYVKAGISEGDVLRMATLEAAKVLGKEHEIGSISKKKRANLILIDGDPTKDISNIRRVHTVIKNGKIYDLKKILAAVSIQWYE